MLVRLYNTGPAGSGFAIRVTAHFFVPIATDFGDCKSSPSSVPDFKS